MRKYLYTLLLSLSITTSFAQSNFYKLGIGAGTGGNYTFTDVKKGAFSLSSYASFDYLFTPFISGSLEAQFGTLKGGDVITDAHLRQFENGYMAIMVNGKVRAGQFTDFYYNDFLNYTKGFYVGTGIGLIQNNMNKIVRVKPDGSNYIFPGENKSSNLLVPVNVGIDFYFPDSWGDTRYVLNFNFQGNITFGEGLDGYNDPQTMFKNSSPDMYTYLSVGFRYSFGPLGLSRKSIR